MVYVGTYADAIYRSAPGEGPRVVAMVSRNSFLALHPNRLYLYSVTEEREGLIGAWRIEPTSGVLKQINQADSGGAGPCHIALDATGSMAVVSNYGGASVMAVGIRPDGGFGETLTLYRTAGAGPRLPRQAASHPHGAFFSPDNELAVVPDLGLDELFLYRLNDTLHRGDPPSVDLPPGSGPRHFAFHPGGWYGYAICELDSSIATLRRTGADLEMTATVSSLPPGYQGKNIAGGIAIDADGRFLYCSNRGADTIGVFAVKANGELETVQHIASGGATPRHIAIDPTGEWLLAANQDSDCVCGFHRNLETGCLTASRFQIGVPKPACIVFC